MWISKPYLNLNGPERELWSKIQSKMQKNGEEVGISQSSVWCAALTAIQVPSWVIFSPDHEVGGMVFCTHSGTFECINGPFLHWDDSKQVMGELAVFAKAVSQLPGFQKLILRPRWLRSTLESRLSHLAIAPLRIDEAATRVLDLTLTDEQLRQGFSERLKRNLKQNGHNTFHYSSFEVKEGGSHASLQSILPIFQDFSKQKSFVLPDSKFIETLLLQKGLLPGEQFQFYCAEASVEKDGAQSKSHLVSVVAHGVCHYLFGASKKTGAEFSSSLSSSALLHVSHLHEMKKLGAHTYDFNGYLEAPKMSDPYLGVNEFKRQFGGEIRVFSVPHFEIGV